MAGVPMTPGSEQPSSLGGTGWQPRTGSHREELAAGLAWRPCGYTSEVARLLDVMVTVPPASIGAGGDARARLMREPVDLAAISAQADGLIAAFRRYGVTVHLARPPDDAPPNVVFMRDLFLMTPEGAIVGRAASVQRAGEERYAAEALAAAGFPILATVTGRATFEGADALWLDADTVVVGVGFRTNAAGARAVTRVLAEQGVAVRTVPLGPGVQHLLGAVVPVADRLAAVHAAAAGPPLRAVLGDLGYRLIEVPADAELLTARGMNLVTLEPGRVLMPTSAPTIRRRLETAGVAVEEVEVGEYVKADGALGCLTGIVRRQR
jgi:N-dimethylarginine dimethylaminohydrolase